MDFDRSNQGKRQKAKRARSDSRRVAHGFSSSTALSAKTTKTADNFDFFFPLNRKRPSCPILTTLCEASSKIGAFIHPYIAYQKEPLVIPW